MKLIKKEEEMDVNLVLVIFVQSCDMFPFVLS